MFISVLDLFKIGVGPSSSHTMGPMLAASEFLRMASEYFGNHPATENHSVRCILKGSLASTGKGHATDRAVALGLHGYNAAGLGDHDVESLVQAIWEMAEISLPGGHKAGFIPAEHIVFDLDETLPEHPNGLVFELLDANGTTVLTETWFSIGGGFITTLSEINQLVAPLKMEQSTQCPFPFDSAAAMLDMSSASGLSIAGMKRQNETKMHPESELDKGLDRIWNAMRDCIRKGLDASGILPGGLDISRRARDLYQQLQSDPENANINDWLCAYAMAVNEENAAGHRVVTAPTNGAAGVIPAVLHYLVEHENLDRDGIHDYLLTAAAIGGLIKHRSSISGAEVGCQGEVGSAAAMAAAGVCAVKGGTTEQVENAAEIALEHHLGMTCDPVNGLVQVPCIERNGFGAIKAYTAATLALRGSGTHFMPLDNCIAAMKQTGQEMSDKFKETARGGLAVSITEC